MKYIIFFFLIGFYSCNNSALHHKAEENLLENPKYFYDALQNLTDVIVHDIFSPPVASRVYVYPNIAAYEILAKKNSAFHSLSSKLKDLDNIPEPQDTSNISFSLAAIYAHIECGKALVFSEDKMVQHLSLLNNHLDSIGISNKTKSASYAYAHKVSAHIMNWADKDNYKESRSFPKFTISDDPFGWKPTPPAYMEAIEPHWREIRTMVLQKADQFIPSPPPNFDMSPDSDFYKKTIEVMDAVNNATEEHIKIASFWDCNPYVINQTGHMMFASKKITPGGHWIGIASIASKTAGHNLMQAIATNTFCSIALFDAFISCWDEKYRSNLIRPETVINEYIDEDWKPILQTPPFPEHTSGHSVISSAAAYILTQVLGSDFSYTDDVEVKYGLEKRNFSSFFEASDQAAISRLYGGIHYMPAITDGVDQGKKIGQYIADKLTLTKHE